jgi:hypothetical protein
VRSNACATYLPSTGRNLNALRKGRVSTDSGIDFYKRLALTGHYQPLPGTDSCGQGGSR